MSKTSNEIIREAARVFAKQEKLKREQRALEDQIRVLCAEFRVAENSACFPAWGLRNAVEARTGKRFNV